MKSLTLRNEYHNTEVTIRPREDGTISAATFRRAARTLCPPTDCRCTSSPASGPDTEILGHAEAIFAGCSIVAYRLPRAAVRLRVEYLKPDDAAYNERLIVEGVGVAYEQGYLVLRHGKDTRRFRGSSVERWGELTNSDREFCIYLMDLSW